MATLLDGKALAARIREEVAREVAELGDLGLTTVLVGDDPASHIYINTKHKAATEAGMTPQDIRLPAETSEEDLLVRIAQLNADDAVDGILVQLPLPAHIDEARIIRAIAPMKDVDGLHPFNAGELFLDRPTLAPATPSGVLELLTEYMVKQGAAVVDVGINRTESGVVGDVEPDAAERAAFISPVPGGVGPMTIAMLLRNTVKAARYRRGHLAFPGT